jgi:hypothetical protein
VQPEEEGIMAVEPLVAALNICTDQAGDEAAGGECSLYACPYLSNASGLF